LCLFATIMFQRGCDNLTRFTPIWCSRVAIYKFAWCPNFTSRNTWILEHIYCGCMPSTSETYGTTHNTYFKEENKLIGYAVLLFEIRELNLLHSFHQFRAKNAFTPDEINY
jgi:hypothetical protein